MHHRELTRTLLYITILHYMCVMKLPLTSCSAFASSFITFIIEIISQLKKELIAHCTYIITKILCFLNISEIYILYLYREMYVHIYLYLYVHIYSPVNASEAHLHTNHTQ